LATGARPAPAEPDPFEPLPVASPGRLVDEEGRPATAPPDGYPVSFPTDGIRVDDRGHPRDLLEAARSVVDLVFEDGPARWQEVLFYTHPAVERRVLMAMEWKADQPDR